jgi:hypothetical protein
MIIITLNKILLAFFNKFVFQVGKLLFLGILIVKCWIL